MDPLRFLPVYKDYVWGGRTFEKVFKRTLPEGIIAESWELVDREADQSVVAEGRFKGMTLRQLIEQHGREILKPDWPGGRRFPLLIKWLDARARLSLQVHPPAEVAAELHGEPKTECWYVAHAEPGAGLFAGLKRGVTREAFEQALSGKTLEPLLHRIPTRSGDFIFIPSGRIHAIDTGNLILEIQQNSDTTYRVHDWGRPRETHVAQSLRSIDFADFEPSATPDHTSARETTLLEHPLFSVKKFLLHPGEVFELPPSPTAQILTFAEGACLRYQAGENLLIPHSSPFKITASKPTLLLLTYNFL